MAAILLAASLSLSADTTMGAGSLQSWNPSILGSPGTGPYWNNQSGDGNNGSIGGCVTGSAACPIASPPGAISYFGNGTNAVSNMFFGDSVGQVRVSLLGVFTSQIGNADGVDYFGWYSIRSDGTLGAMARLWSSAEPVGTSAIFDPNGNYGFFIENIQGMGTPFQADYFWFMNTAFDSTGGTAVDPANHQHFAIFSGAQNRFWLGMEDSTPGDLDFNDLIVQVTAGVPEPASFTLMTGGLLFCGYLFRRVIHR